MKAITFKRALISVSDKTGLEDLVTMLCRHGVELISTGGTAKAIRDFGMKVTDVSDITDFPEMMDGRVKTLHPLIHGGLLALRENETHVQSMTAHNIPSIDLLVVNLYPFQQSLAKGAAEAELIENIDIGGPAMIRSAAKNHAYVAVITDPADYALLTTAQTSLAQRKLLAAKAFTHTAQYDAAISNWFMGEVSEDKFPQTFISVAERANTLRYGENPHQKAALYIPKMNKVQGAPQAKQVQGKELSYNNYNDADAALELLSEFAPDTPSVVIVKHANPCGVAQGATLLEAYQAAYACDSVSAFGGIVALNQVLDGATAEAICEIFTEVVLAPGADADALAIFSAKKNLRLMLIDAALNPRRHGLMVKDIAGGLLLQERDNGQLADAQLQVVTKRLPSAQELADCRFAWLVAKHTKSNAIVYAKSGATAGIGAGQMNRRDSARIAALKAQEAAERYGWPQPHTHGSAVASDAFFPFADGLHEAIAAGATAVIQPGGSMRDAEVIAAADAAGIAMIFTGMRHFKH
jgi:phosphoribosylaminoimidazolecarboxamide formyltransferase / IMP cyclohydrolase